MGTIGRAQNPEQGRQMHFHGAFCDIERQGNFLVRLALDQAHEDLALSGRKALHGTAADLQPATFLWRPLGQDWRHIDLSAQDIAQALDQLVWMLALYNVAVYPCRERSENVLPAIGGADDDDLRLRARTSHLRNALGAHQTG